MTAQEKETETDKKYALRYHTLRVRTARAVGRARGVRAPGKVPALVFRINTYFIHY